MRMRISKESRALVGTMPAAAAATFAGPQFSTGGEADSSCRTRGATLLAKPVIDRRMDSLGVRRMTLRDGIRSCVAARTAAALMAAGLVCGAAVGDAEAMRRFAVEDGPTAVDAQGGVIAWSRYVTREHVFRLVIRRDSRTLVAPVAGRAVPFDLGVGTGADGRTVVTYSRCRREPSEALVVRPAISRPSGVWG